MMQDIKFTQRVYIFGAQSRGKTIKEYLQFLYPQTKVLAFLVDSAEENEAEIDKIPVWRLDTAGKLDGSYSVFIATKGIYHNAIRERLEQKGMMDIIPVTAAVDNFFRNEYVRKLYLSENGDFTKITDLSVQKTNAVIYMVKSIFDKPLQAEYICPEYEKVIQAGAALTEKRLSADTLTDSEGDTISSKNRQYCELTALYWIWKNSGESIIGLSHYRRHFILPDQWQEIMVSNGIDVILPVPTCVYPSIEENYKERHDPSDWDYLMEYLKEHSPEDYRVSGQVFSGNLYLPCNMFIMRRKILDDLCCWMFPILDAVTANGGEKQDTYLNRYPGFISERLITLYFYKNRFRYRIVYADKNFIE